MKYGQTDSSGRAHFFRRIRTMYRSFSYQSLICARRMAPNICDLMSRFWCSISRTHCLAHSRSVCPSTGQLDLIIGKFSRRTACLLSLIHICFDRVFSGFEDTGSEFFQEGIGIAIFAGASGDEQDIHTKNHLSGSGIRE